MTMIADEKDPVAAGLTAEGIAGLCDDGLTEATRIADGIRAQTDVADANLTWEATFGAFDDIAFALQKAILIPQLIRVCHPNAAVRAAADACKPRVDAFTTALYMDDAAAGVLKRAAARLGPLPNPRGRFVEHTLRDYRRNGLELPAEQRKRLAALNERLTALEQAFDKNLAEATSSINVAASSLNGLPSAYVTAHPAQPDGTVRISTDTPDYVPFLRYSEDRTSARELSRLVQNRARTANLEILNQLLTLRHKKAALLGYATWVDYVLEPRMAKTSNAVGNFIDRLHRGLAPRRAEEFADFFEEAMLVGLVDADRHILTSDAPYLEDRVRRKKFQLDSQALSEYFEVHAVQRGIMEIVSTIYGVAFARVDCPTWHADVEAYDVCDTTTNTAFGRIYLDLFPRDAKFKHAGVFPLRETRHSKNERTLPIAALVCNFPKPDEAKAFLDHDQVTTFFHEFGHLMHHVFSQSELASFAGTNVVWDFVEVPSQLFEEWAWTRETLDLFAKHHATGKPIPETLYQSLIHSRTFGEAISTDRQLFLAKLDQRYHTQTPPFDTSAVLETLQPEFSPFTRIPDTYFQATFGHLVGYDAAYYGYQWALSIAFDVRSRFLREGFLNAETAAAYRRAILEPGGGEDPAELVQRFLDRAPDERSYLAYLGIGRTA